MTTIRTPDRREIGPVDQPDLTCPPVASAVRVRLEPSLEMPGNNGSPAEAAQFPAQNRSKSSGKPGRSGGAPGHNRNATSHGIRGWLAIGSYPKGASHVRRLIGRLRVQLEAAVCEQHGAIGIFHAALIQSACRHEGRALLLTRWLRHEADLPLSDRLAVLKEIGNATDSRDRCLRAAGLDRTPSALNPWEAFDAEMRSGHVETHDPVAQHATGATPEAAE